MVEFDQMWFIFQHSLPCGPHTSYIHIAALGFPWYRSSHPDPQKKNLKWRSNLIIDPIQLPSRVVFSWWETVRWCQIRRMWRMLNQFKATLTYNNHCNLRLVCRALSWLNRTIPSSVFQAVLTWLPLAAASASWHRIPHWWFGFSEGSQWTQCPLHPRRRRPSPSLPWHHLGLLWRGRRGGVSTAWIVVWSLARSGGPNTHLGWGNVQESWLDLLEKVPGRPTTGPAWWAFDQAPMAVAPTERKPSICHFRCAECSLLVLGRCLLHALAVRLTGKRLSSITMHVVNTVDVFLGCGCGRTSGPWVIFKALSLPLLISVDIW